MKIKCIGARTADGRLTDGKVYATLNGIEPGIFENRPFVTVIDDFGKKSSWHASRFEIVSGSDGGTDNDSDCM